MINRPGTLTSRLPAAFFDLRVEFCLSTLAVCLTISSLGKYVAPICWVIPPASPSCTLPRRILSSSLVLPVSTWPSTATMGERSCSCDRFFSACSRRLWMRFSASCLAFASALASPVVTASASGLSALVPWASSAPASPSSSEDLSQASHASATTGSGSGWGSGVGSGSGTASVFSASGVAWGFAATASPPCAPVCSFFDFFFFSYLTGFFGAAPSPAVVGTSKPIARICASFCSASAFCCFCFAVKSLPSARSRSLRNLVWRYDTNRPKRSSRKRKAEQSMATPQAELGSMVETCSSSSLTSFPFLFPFSVGAPLLLDVLLLRCA
eukprot:m.84790 g.84790  ORF g.84790 m.84790 type:complete len:326 (-) comp14819_c1_seq2:174-1151(-)